MSQTNDRTAEDGSAWRQLAENRAPESFAKGSLIYELDQPADDLFLVASGRVGLYLRSPEGRSLTLHAVEAGQLFGHVSLAGGEGYDSFAEASSPAQLYRVPAAEVRSLVEAVPAIGLRLLEDLGRHRATVSQRLDEVAFKSVPARLASVLLDLAHRHDSAESGRVPRHSHRQLAEMVNAYRETVTKVINQFRDARLLEIERHTIMLLNRRRLEELAQG
jgi:CRP/FNR family transcriptional regulator, cyclic AMP receptor protein